MSDTRVHALIVADDRDVGARVAAILQRRGYHVRGAVTYADATSASISASDAVVASIKDGADKDVAALCDLAARSGATPIVAVHEGAHLDAKLLERLPAGVPLVASQDDERLSTSIDSLATSRPSAERRLVWELQIVNEIAEVISRSLELDDVLAGALQRLIPAFDGVGGAIRLRDELTGQYVTAAVLGAARARELFYGPNAIRPLLSDRVIATRKAVIVADMTSLAVAAGEPLAVQSGISVPMVVKGELIGTLSVGASMPHRFSVFEERLLAMIGANIGVAVQNARLHDSVRRGKREWEQTFDAISDPIAVFDGRGHLLRGNTALASLLGRQVTDMRLTSCHEVGFCGGSFPQCSVGDAILCRRANRSEVTLANGQIFSVTTLPFGDREGPSVVQFAKNVTEEIRSARRLRQMSDELGVANARLTATVEQLKSTQAQLLQAEKLSAIGQLVAGVAHELNNPLTSVIGYAQLLEEELLEAGGIVRPTVELAQDLRRIADESERAARIVRNLLAFARRQTAARAPQDLAELTTRVLSLRTYEMRLNAIELQTDFEPGLPRVMADSSQIQQALLNLVLNAEQALRGRSPRRLAVALRFDKEASAVQLSITDNGHGIEHANLTRIFDPFFTTRDVGEGTGLGLSICYGIVRDHGGQIVVESRLQVGTTFSVYLPARLESAMPAESLLVAHGEQGERDFLTAALAGWGYTVLSAATSEEALERCRAGGVRGVFLDRHLLASDLAGWTAARSGKARHLPLVLLARAAEDGDVDRFGREQAGAILTPPYQLRALRSAVRAVAKEYV